MSRLVTLEELKRELGYEGITDQDQRLTDLADDASAVVLNYISDTNPAAYSGWASTAGVPLVDTNGDPETDTNGDSIVPRGIRRATVLVAGTLNENREGQVDPITPAVKTLLARYHTPVAV